jgi:hypothetical protein
VDWKEMVSGVEWPGGKIFSAETKDIVGIPYQTTSGKDTAECEDLVRAILNCRMV